MLQAYQNETDIDSDTSVSAPQVLSESQSNLPTSRVCKGPNPAKDQAYQNLRLLTRDLLYVDELICAISEGDIGRIEDFFPHLTMMFRGAGSNNYCMEILHFILSLKYIWTPKFAYVLFQLPTASQIADKMAVTSCGTIC